MKKQLLFPCFLMLTLTLTMVLTLTGTVAMQGVDAKFDNVQAQTSSISHTLKLSLGSDDPTIDPALSIDRLSLFVTNQLFLGLTRVNYETGDPVPELATSWEMSADAQVFTITLRSDATWSNGDSVTAYDVQYGILRSLAPDTNASWAYPLFVIQNAEAYNDGSITDPAQVGITVLDDTHIRFDLNRSAAHFISFLALPTARAMPAAVIAAHPDDWTEPANIVTNGPYELATWTHSISMTLKKRADYYGAANVQIDQVLFSIVDDITAWEMYKADQLDSAIVPQDEWQAAQNDPLLQQELSIAPYGCIYYYGFNTVKAPFDDVRVRQAFIAAVNRKEVIDETFGYAYLPALTFTPPGHFGHVDGYAEGIGIPYNPYQAQQLLTDAGYPNGQGLPEITLMYNTSTGHQAIAESVRQDWIDSLGVTVTLSDTTWLDYLDLLANDPPQVWRLGWCSDYNDAYNYLHDNVEIHRVSHGNWINTTYDDLISQAARTVDLDTRKMLYKQAEEILVETDAIMLPITHYADGVATKPYLERTYGNAGFGGYIAEWRFTQASTVIETEGGDLTSYNGDTTVQIPSGAITGTIVITHTPATGISPSGNLNSIGDMFDLTAVYTGADPGTAGLPAQIVPGYTYTVTVGYSGTQLGPTIEDTLGLYWWDGDTWSQQGITNSVNTTDDVVTAQVNHFSRFAVLGETRRVYLPVVLRN